VADASVGKRVGERTRVPLHPVYHRGAAWWSTPSRRLRPQMRDAKGAGAGHVVQSSMPKLIAECCSSGSARARSERGLASPPSEIRPASLMHDVNSEGARRHIQRALVRPEIRFLYIKARRNRSQGVCLWRADLIPLDSRDRLGGNSREVIAPKVLLKT